MTGVVHIRLTGRDLSANSQQASKGSPPTLPTPAAAGILRSVFKALVCSVLFFIAIGAVGMWFATKRRGRD